VAAAGRRSVAPPGTAARARNMGQLLLDNRSIAQAMADRGRHQRVLRANLAPSESFFMQFNTTSR